MVADPLHFCSSLASSPRAADRMLWLRIASDLVGRTDRAGGALGSEFEAQFADCLRYADEAARLALAQKICGAVRSPGRIVLAFLDRADPAAAWTLRHAPRVPAEALRRAAGSPRLSRYLAERADLADDVIDDLLALGDFETRIALAGNVSAKLKGDRLVGLVSQARASMDTQRDLRMAAALLRRAPMTMAYAPLFLVASPSQRSQILMAAQRADLGRDRAAAFAEVSELQIADLERHALKRQSKLFEADLAAALNCPGDLAGLIAEDPSGEPLAVALAAIRAPNEVCVRILTSRDMADGPDYRRLGALARLQGALSVSAARAVISAMVGRSASAPAPAAPQSRHSAASPGRAGAEAVRLIRQRQSPQPARADAAG